MGKIRLNEALARAKDNGKRVTKKRLAQKIWPESSEASAQMNLAHMAKGQKVIGRVVDALKIIADETGVTVDFLVGLKND